MWQSVSCVATVKSEEWDAIDRVLDVVHWWLGFPEVRTGTCPEDVAMQARARAGGTEEFYA